MSTSILIKDMEMPKSCESCPCKTADAFGGLGCQATGYIPLRKANQDRPDNCPLIELLPHGRLIDADALIDAGWQLSRDNIFTGKYEIALLSSVPTIIPADPEQEEMK